MERPADIPSACALEFLSGGASQKGARCLLKNHIVEWQECAEEEQEGSDTSEEESRLLQRANELHNLDPLGHWSQSGLDCEVGNNEHSQHQKRRGSHSPWESNFGDEFGDKDTGTILAWTLKI